MRITYVKFREVFEREGQEQAEGKAIKRWRRRDGYQCGRGGEIKKAASLWEQGMGGAAFRSGFSSEVQRLWPPDNDFQKAPGEKRQRNFITEEAGGRR